MKAAKKIPLQSRWMPVMDILTRLDQARANREKQRQLLASVDEQVGARRAELERSLDAVPEGQRRPIVDRTVGGYRTELKRISAAQRLAIVKQAGQTAEAVNLVRSHYRSPVQMLMREGIGSERRSRILQQIEDSGPTELASLAEYAAAQGDRELAAALCSRAGTMPARERTFSRQELADALLGNEFRQVSAALLEIDRLTEEVAHEDTSFETGRRNGARTIRIAQMKQAEQTPAEED